MKHLSKKVAYLIGKYLKSLSESQLKQIGALCAFNKIDMYEGV